ncbi:MAG TPA: ribosome biogenesis GTPase Der [Acidobacteriaceae bacterium]|nr:ribosome biogenesis GTPase Der [Acidobacteriaceae bacterium]
MAKAARRATPATRGQHSRAEIKRGAAAKAAAEASVAARLGKIRKRPVQSQGRMGRIDPVGRIDVEPPDPLALPPVIRREVVVDTSSWPVLVIVGRPNVGKSTLFNRLTSSRRSIVGDEPGITRDRIYGEIEWSGQHARVVDTGGILPDDPELIPSEIFRQARVALDEADSIVMVVDGRTSLAAPDYDLARLLLRGGKPLLLAVNKIDTTQMEEQTAEYRRLGIREMLPISAEHGIGIGELLDHVFATFPKMESAAATPMEAEPELEEEGQSRHRTHGEFQQHETSIAIIGRPNVGKSTLLNVLTGSSRAIVSPIPGTTRDAVDEVMEYDGGLLRFVDTAGIRRKGKTRMMSEKLSVVMARRHLEAADVALLVIDATEGVTSSDATIGGYAHESGRSVILVVNKWDLVTTGRTDGKPPADKEIFEEQLRKVLKYLAYAPVVFISAAEGKNIHTVLQLVKEVAAERRKRVSTGQMNRFLEKIDFQRATVPAASKMRIFYMTQAAVAPPTFILFTNRQVKLHFAFQRFLENQIRAAFGFLGSPIWLKVRARDK